MKSFLIPLMASVAIAAAASGATAAPDVVVSIKPVHSLVAAIMRGVGEPQLIVDGAASPHTYNLRPSNARKLEKADVVFWVGPGLEAFLEKPLEALASKATVVELEDAKGLEKLPFREGGPFEAHDHGDEGHDAHDDHAEEEGAHDHGHDHAEGHGDHDHGAYDTHLWLDPANAKAMAQTIETALIAADAGNAATYQANTKKLIDDLDALDAELKETVKPVKDKPFIVFHDAYQYFEHRYGVKTAGSITVSPETLPGADRVKQMQEKVRQLGATCVFAEPQFEPKLISVITEGTAAKSATLDPEAATLEPGPDLYFKLMRGIAGSLKDCLS
ncbi:zinc ABC transporter substrate-binding protein ZnuA [Agrobacterium radiobacter]|jgi:zinc transport system substrate-binding protein|uniref:High-affinity zinc uptake system protein ZnuA n=1 Tax=Agrobacterium tumefaciens str. B6 TaxID=1183423 RepID=A0A822UY08_AGRTU|nr:zinc ABC transporter substrate-binding protein ZnuA [Agrobacterium tumefaciens]AYM05351.1 zinc transport system substrate-binding protein [Agrobacterium tumefaciens]KWT81565.1 zinc transporter [Agrobacterium tumefaciens str. B6]MQB27100.1 zinc ABC transporter substrate-binding protein [Agrobacterium tumefaciens]NSZ32197.1 zinc ABC transporter substrate-binding protein ZnuA [Agrobacterium tumefaciens]NTA04696.1 zinc ABC transporter substrate-binding protein ZnuA [Agrobacterium tumefaciens]